MVLSVIDQKAQDYVKANRKLLCERFASITLYPSVATPTSYFMAGSPGAGKTEFSKGFIMYLYHPKGGLVLHPFLCITLRVD